MKKYLLELCTLFLLLGCSNVFDEAMEAADAHFEQGEFMEALPYYEQALEEKEDAHVQNQVDQLQMYKEIASLIDKDKWSEAEEAVHTLAEQELAIPLDEAVEAQEAEISEAMIKISKLHETLEDIDALLEEKKVEEGKELMAQVEDSDFFAFVKKDAEKLETSLLKVENTVEKDARQAQAKQEEEEKEAKKQRKRQEAEAAVQAKAKEKQKEKDRKSNISLAGEKEAFLERFAALEEEQENEQNEGVSTLEIREHIWGQIEQWDDELNKAYEVIIDHHPDADAIKEEQREWVERVKKETEDIYFQSEFGGTSMHVESDQHRFNETKQRAYELVNEYME